MRIRFKTHKLLWRLTILFFLSFGSILTVLHYYRIDILHYALCKAFNLDDVIVGKCDGFFPFDLQIQDIEGRQNTKKVLFIKNVSFRFNPSQLFLAKLSFDDFVIDTLEIQDIEASKVRSSQPFDFSLIPSIEIENLDINGKINDLPFDLKGKIADDLISLLLSCDQQKINLEGTLHFWDFHTTATTTLQALLSIAEKLRIVPKMEKPIIYGDISLSIKGSLLKPIQAWEVESKLEGRDYLGDSKATFLLHSRYYDRHLNINGQSLYFGIPKNIHIEGPIEGPYSFDVDSFLLGDKISGAGVLLLDLKEKSIKANAKLDYQGKKIPYVYSLSFKDGISLSIFSKGMIDLSLSYQNSIVLLERCLLYVNGYSLNSQKPVTIDCQKGSISDSSFIINDALLELKGIKFQKDLQGSIQLTDLNLEKVSANDLALKGKIRFKANLLGDVTRPQCQFIVNALNVTQEHQKAFAPLSFDIKGDASLKETTFTLSLLKHPSNIDLQAKGKVFYDDGEPTLDAFLKADFDCQHLKFFVSKRDILSGKIKGNLNLKGPLLSPQLEGTVDIEKGHYSNALVATTLKDLRGTIKLQGSRITPNLVGHDDFSGTLAVIGEYDYLKKAGDIIAKFNRFYLGQSDLFTGCGSGDIAIRPSDESITGTILLHKVIVDLDQLSPSGIPTLRKIEKEEGHEESTDSSLKVKIILKPEKYLLLRGFGIEESLWEGHLILQAVPLKFLGQFKLFKGDVELADKVFKFTRGDVVFDGSIKAPLLDAEVMRKIGGYNVKIQLAGRPKEPKLFFLSEPALMQEEILSLILFGKTTPSGSVGELIDLSSTLSTLHRQGGEGFFTQFRKVFGIESLEFKKGEKITNDNHVNETNSVSIRKQLTPNISLNFEQSLGHSSATESKATLSTDITENLNVEVDVGSNKSGGVGLMWTQRY